jgi:hypothetical protein
MVVLLLVLTILDYTDGAAFKPKNVKAINNNKVSIQTKNNNKNNNKRVTKQQQKNGGSHNDQQQHTEPELMTASTAVMNVLADLCPHGMLPIGTFVNPKLIISRRIKNLYIIPMII